MPPVRDGKSGLLLTMVYDVIQKFSSVYTRLNMRRRSSAMAKQALFLPPNTILCSQAVPGAKTSGDAWWLRYLALYRMKLV